MLNCGKALVRSPTSIMCPSDTTKELSSQSSLSTDLALKGLVRGTLMNSCSVRCRSSFSILGLEEMFKAARRLLARGRRGVCGGAEHFANFQIALSLTSPLTLTNPYELSPKPKSLIIHLLPALHHDGW